jgi:hypothetical protein
VKHNYCTYLISPHVKGDLGLCIWDQVTWLVRVVMMILLGLTVPACWSGLSCLARIVQVVLLV